MCLKFAISLTNLEASDSSLRLMSEMQSIPSLVLRFAMTDIRLALPHLSPYPFIVPCTWVQPACTAAIEFATAISLSLWACMPRGTFSFSLTSLITLKTSEVIMPPFVSHRITISAPLFSATDTVFKAYCGLRIYPSKKCSAS